MGQKRIIYACDVGTTKAKSGLQSFAWARLNPDDGAIHASRHIDKLIQQLESDIRQGYSISLGFEAPLFIPVPENWQDLSKRREGEGNRPWSASSGAHVTTLGIHQSAWILKKLHESSSGRCEFTLDWRRWWPPSGHQPILFCWEAFVSGKAHSDDHTKDAATAADFFHCHEQKLEEIREVKAKCPISLIGAVALWSGWVRDLKFIHEPTLVIKPKEQFRGNYQNLDCP
jgi:hypothetical protein